MRILIISDIHANLVALDTVLAHAGQFDRIWCLGDIVGYGPEPNECIDKLRSFDPVCIAGNHDWAALDKLDLDEFNADARRAAIWTRSQLTPTNLEWLSGLPERILEQADKFTLVHGSPRHPIWEYVLTHDIAYINFDYFSTPICLMGHTHVPVIFRDLAAQDKTISEPFMENIPVTLDSERLMINPGSVGQPRDGDPRSAFAILDVDLLTITHHRVPYDMKATQMKMEQFKLPARLIQRLSFGR